MTPERIDELNAAVARHDLVAFVELFHPDAVWQHNPGGGSPEEGTYEGRDQIRRLFERILEGWDYMRPTPSEVSEADPGVYLVRGELRCKHTTSRAEIAQRYEQRLEFRDGLMARGRMVLGS
jgi:ketosteroid isomerase-like protein